MEIGSPGPLLLMGFQLWVTASCSCPEPGCCGCPWVSVLQGSWAEGCRWHQLPGPEVSWILLPCKARGCPPKPSNLVKDNYCRSQRPTSDPPYGLRKVVSPLWPSGTHPTPTPCPIHTQSYIPPQLTTLQSKWVDGGVLSCVQHSTRR